MNTIENKLTTTTRIDLIPKLVVDDIPYITIINRLDNKIMLESYLSAKDNAELKSIEARNKSR
jgi:hypothetical protein